MLKQIVDMELTLDGELEHAYRQSTLRNDVNQVKVIGIIYALSLTLYSIIDYQLFGFSKIFLILTTLRGFMVLWTMATLFILRRINSHDVMDWVVFILELGVIFLTLYIDSTRPSAWLYSVPVNLVIIIGLIIAVPNKLIFRAIPVFLFSIGVILEHVQPGPDIDPIGFRSMSIAIVIAHIIGWTASIRMYRYRRDQFKAQREENRLRKQVEYLATHDSLTQIYNRHQFMELANTEFQRYQRYHRPFVLLLFDLDHFKLVNDNYGHRTGDFALQKFSSLVTSQVRQADILGRIGGEEFALILPETDKDCAVALANRIQKACEQMVLARGDETFHITTSIGLSEVRMTDGSFEDMYERADKLLYQAKRNGRNQIAYEDYSLHGYSKP